MGYNAPSETDMTSARPPIILAHRDLQDLIQAKRLLENPGLTARLASAIGARRLWSG